MQLSFIDPGRFRTEFELQAAAAAPDGLGGHAENWTAVAVVLSAIEPVRARPSVEAERQVNEVTHLVTMRHRDDVASGMRPARGLRVFDVVAVHDPDETGRYLVCRVREEGR